MLSGRDRQCRPDPHRSRTARGKHYVIFDLPADKGLELLKTKQPSLSWASDINGHPALPYSIAARLILPVHTDRVNPGVKLFAEYPAAQLFAHVFSIAGTRCTCVLFGEKGMCVT